MKVDICSQKSYFRIQVAAIFRKIESLKIGYDKNFLFLYTLRKCFHFQFQIRIGGATVVTADACIVE